MRWKRHQTHKMIAYLTIPLIVNGDQSDRSTLIKDTHLIDWDTGQEAWPPRSRLATTLATMMVPAFDPRYHQGKWYEVVAERDERERQDNDRASVIHAERARQREETENSAVREGWRECNAEDNEWRKLNSFPSACISRHGLIRYTHRGRP
jgi:hypothetical protein